MTAILTILLAAAGSGPPSAPYSALVRRYAAGEMTAAVSELREWPETRVRDEVRAVMASAQKCTSPDQSAPGAECAPEIVWPGFPITAALMLHTDTARADAASDVHERAAVTLAGLFVDFPALADFGERWYGLRARLARAENRWPEAEAWAEKGVAAFPRSARLWLLLGSIEETLMVGGVDLQSDGLPFDPDPLGRRRRLLAIPGKPTEQAASRRADTLFLTSDPLRARGEKEEREPPREYLVRAQRALEKAAALRPELGEARLRLARLAWWSGDLVSSRSALDRLLATPDEPGTTFLARIFMGRLLEDEGQLAAAAASYEAALRLEPQCQSARLALSHARQRLGDLSAARRELELALRNAGSRSRPDPYWLYLAPTAGSADLELAALRREVVR